jgi:DNA-binding response OmpR family regulator
MTAVLEGVRVLVVEDEYLVAVLIEEILESAGCIVKGPIPRVPEALDAVGNDSYDAAVLDVNLAGERINPVADALSERNVPFMFVTGYGANGLPTEYSERPHICKPFRMHELISALSSVVKAPTTGTSRRRQKNGSGQTH